MRLAGGTVSGAAGFGGALLLLPVLTLTVGAKAAVPILTVAQLLGNLSRAGFGWREIRWRPALLFSAGAVPASVLGSRLFVALPSGLILRLIGVFLLIVVGLAAHAAWRAEDAGMVLRPGRRCGRASCRPLPAVPGRWVRRSSSACICRRGRMWRARR